MGDRRRLYQDGRRIGRIVDAFGFNVVLDRGVRVFVVGENYLCAVTVVSGVRWTRLTEKGRRTQVGLSTAVFCSQWNPEERHVLLSTYESITT